MAQIALISTPEGIVPGDGSIPSWVTAMRSPDGFALSRCALHSKPFATEARDRWDDDTGGAPNTHNPPWWGVWYARTNVCLDTCEAFPVRADDVEALELARISLTERITSLVAQIRESFATVTKLEKQLYTVKEMLLSSEKGPDLTNPFYVTTLEAVRTAQAAVDAYASDDQLSEMELVRKGVAVKTLARMMRARDSYVTLNTLSAEAANNLRVRDTKLDQALRIVNSRIVAWIKDIVNIYYAVATSLDWDEYIADLETTKALLFSREFIVHVPVLTHPRIVRGFRDDRKAILESRERAKLAAAGVAIAAKPKVRSLLARKTIQVDGSVTVNTDTMTTAIPAMVPQAPPVAAIVVPSGRAMFGAALPPAQAPSAQMPATPSRLPPAQMPIPSTPSRLPTPVVPVISTAVGGGYRPPTGNAYQPPSSQRGVPPRFH